VHEEAFSGCHILLVPLPAALSGCVYSWVYTEGGGGLELEINVRAR
jgi:hypothetical protein